MENTPSVTQKIVFLAARKKNGDLTLKFCCFLLLMFNSACGFAGIFNFSNSYVDLFGGYNFVSSYKNEGVQIEPETGFVVGGVFGANFLTFIRLEEEISYRKNKFDFVMLNNTLVPISGSIEAISSMTNLIFDIRLLGDYFVPYLGAGLGEKWEKQEMRRDRDSNQFSGKYGFVCQGIVGVSCCILPIIQAAVEYHYLDGPNTNGNHTLDIRLGIHF